MSNPTNFTACPGCAKSVSRSDTSCPGCGSPLEAPKDATLRTELGALLKCWADCGNPLEAPKDATLRTQTAPTGGHKLTVFARIVAFYCVFISPGFFVLDVLMEAFRVVLNEQQAERLRVKSEPLRIYDFEQGYKWVLIIVFMFSLLATVDLCSGGRRLLRMANSETQARQSMVRRLNWGFIGVLFCIECRLVIFGLSFVLNADDTVTGAPMPEAPLAIFYLLLILCKFFEAILIFLAASWFWVNKH